MHKLSHLHIRVDTVNTPMNNLWIKHVCELRGTFTCAQNETHNLPGLQITLGMLWLTLESAKVWLVCSCRLAPSVTPSACSSISSSVCQCWDKKLLPTTLSSADRQNGLCFNAAAQEDHKMTGCCSTSFEESLISLRMNKLYVNGFLRILITSFVN